MEKCLIVAVADNNAIGRKNALLWNLPGDMKYFREQTSGNAVIMGWMTYQSIGRPLPKRHNIVISLFPWPEAPAEVTVVESLEDAFDAAEEMADQVGHDDVKAFVIGGAYTYAQAMDIVDTMYITHVHDAPQDADAFFPAIDPEVWREDSRSETQVDPTTGITYEFVVYRRR
ncbi:MAG: dihydrofolate reductase [Bacteroidales bacterium]|nr:dihydrofolate reductase [Bacteroidales bacterium]